MTTPVQTDPFGRETADVIIRKLDPISVIAVALILSHSEPDSRLTYTSKYKVCVQRPSEYNYLGLSGKKLVLPVTRWLKGQSREDLNCLPIAIDRVIRWFPPTEEENQEYAILLRNLSEYALTKLQETYERRHSDLTVSALERWQGRVQSALEGNLVLEEDDDDDLREYLESIWTKTDVHCINAIFGQIVEKGIDSDIEEQISGIEDKLKFKYAALRRIYNVQLANTL